MTSIISGPAISVVNSVLDKVEKTVETRTRKHAQTISKSLYIQTVEEMIKTLEIDEPTFEEIAC